MKKREYKFTDGILYMKCAGCSARKTSGDYHKAKNGLFGFRSECKECVSNRCKIRYSSKRDEIATQNREYYRDNKERINNHKREYYRNTRRQSNYRDYLTMELGFNRQTFHEKARNYVKKHGLTPSKCSICGLDKKVEIHHPNYDSPDDWSKIVFCCHSCHRRIHSGNIENPQPINLLDKTYVGTRY